MAESRGCVCVCSMAESRWFALHMVAIVFPSNADQDHCEQEDWEASRLRLHRV